MVISETLARLYFGDQDPIGQSIQTIMNTGNPNLQGDRVREVVGVVGDIRMSFRSDFAPIIYIGYTPNLIAAYPKLQAANLKELIEHARAHPGKITWASPGMGSNPHIALEMLKAATGIHVVHDRVARTGSMRRAVPIGLQLIVAVSALGRGALEAGQARRAWTRRWSAVTAVSRNSRPPTWSGSAASAPTRGT